MSFRTPLERLKDLPYGWRCTGACGLASPFEVKQNAEDGCPSCIRIAIHRNGAEQEYRLPTH